MITAYARFRRVPAQKYTHVNSPEIIQFRADGPRMSKRGPSPDGTASETCLQFYPGQAYQLLPPPPPLPPPENPPDEKLPPPPEENPPPPDEPPLPPDEDGLLVIDSVKAWLMEL